MTKFIACLMLVFELISTLLSRNSANLSNFSEIIYTYKNREQIIQEKFCGKVSDYVWNENEEFDISKTSFVKKEKGKDFTVLNIADIHFADFDAKRIAESFFVTKTIKDLVKKVKPDLIFLLGDSVCTESTVHSINRVVDLMESFGIPWAPMFGNHDDEGNCDLNYLADVMMSGKHCLMQKGDPSMGVGNYIVNVAEDNNDGTTNIIESFIVMDSHKGSVYDNQIQWYKWACDGINKYTNNKAEISLVEHIPIPEYQLAIDNSTVGEKTGMLLNDPDSFGEIHETICCERSYPDGNIIQRGFFDIIKASNTTKYVFCGHDHLNNFSVLYDGVRLTYNMKCGFNSGSRFNFNGGTVIKINDNGIKSITQKSKVLCFKFDYYKIDTQK